MGSAGEGSRRGFTLIEMLTVVAIMGVLAGLLSVAAVQVRLLVRNRVMHKEIQSLDAAVRICQGESGGMSPPDLGDEQAVAVYLAKRFPHYQGDWKAALSARGLDPARMDQASALVLWLGGLPASPGSTKLVGFSANPRDPFDDGPNRIGMFFNFDRQRLRNEQGALRYQPPFGEGEPYVYFASRSGRYDGSWSACRPMRDTRFPENDWVQPDGFQIRAPGLDGRHGAGVRFPAGDDYDEFQHDDLASFAATRLGDEIP